MVQLSRSKPFPEYTEIVATPGETEVTNPVSSTVATLLLLLSHTTVKSSASEGNNETFN